MKKPADVPELQRLVVRSEDESSAAQTDDPEHGTETGRLQPQSGESQTPPALMSSIHMIHENVDATSATTATLCLIVMATPLESCLE